MFGYTTNYHYLCIIYINSDKYSSMITEDAKEYIRKNYAGKSIAALAREVIALFNIKYKVEDSVRRRISKIINTEILNKSGGVSIKDSPPRVLNKSKYYIITWEQNNSILHKELWKNILAYKEFLGAELSVILGTYNAGDNNKDVRWSEETMAYWDYTRHDIHKYVNILSDINIRPTAINPLSGLDGISRDKTSIIGHPKRHLICLPTLEKAPHKALLTTMAISLPNYTYSKEGKKGEFTHRYGFVIVEINSNEVFHVRQVEATPDGSFIDLIHKVSNGEVTSNTKAEALVWGDLHIGQEDPRVIEQTKQLIKRLNIETSVLHDLADGESVNNHILNNPIQQHHRFKEHKDDVYAELQKVKNFLYDIPTRNNVIVNSNHDNRFDRWINSSDWKKDIKNAKAYLELAALALEDNKNRGILVSILEGDPLIASKITPLGLNDSYRILGIECSYHGHIGSNGSRGSLASFRALNVPNITGHSHSLGCLDYAYAVGTSTYLRLGYNVGASNWAQGHCIIHTNGIVQQIIFSRGKFTTFNIQKPNNKNITDDK